MKKIIGAVGIRTIKAHRNCPHAGYSNPVVHVSLPGYLELNGCYIIKNIIPLSVLLITELHAPFFSTAAACYNGLTKSSKKRIRAVTVKLYKNLMFTVLGTPPPPI